MEMNDICINCFKPTGGEEVCMHCGFIQTDKPKQICHLYPKTVLNNRYMIGRVINNGGFGVVYKAYDMRLERIVAIKELLPTQNSMVTRVPPSPEVIPVNEQRKETFEKLKKRFMKESRVMAQFSECNSIVRVFDFFETNNTVYLVMEYLDGVTLRQFLDQNGKQMDFDTALETLMPILQALKVIHGAGVIHKDISPDNIFICTDGTVKLIDFGAAQFDENDTGAETSSSVVLKVGYTPPEQYRTNAVVTPSADIYSIGAVFYAVLSGEIPLESIDRIENDNLQKLSKRGIALPLYADKAIMKAMALKESSRFQSIDAFTDAITGKKKAEFPEVEIRKKKVRNAVLVSLTVLVLIAAVLVTYTVKSMNSIIPKKSTTIELWYEDTGNKELNARWKKAVADFKEFAINQNSELGETNVKVVAVPEKEYKSKLKKAFADGNAPDIYQAVDDEFDDKAASLKPLISKADEQKMSPAYEVMRDTYAEHNKLAVCFDMPVLYTYINNTKNKAPKASLSAVDLLHQKKMSGFTHTLICNPEAVMPASYAYGKGACDKAVAGELFEASKTFDLKGKYLSPTALFLKDKKSKQKAMYYIGMMSEYSDMVNQFKLGVSAFDVGLLTGDKVSELYTFPELWSISNKTDIVHRNTANLFLYFLLCNMGGQFDMTRIGSIDTYYLPMLAQTEQLNKLIENYSTYAFIFEEKAMSAATTVPYSEVKSVESKTESIITASQKKDSAYDKLS